MAATAKRSNPSANGSDNSFTSVGTAVEIRPIVRQIMAVQIRALRGSFLLMNNGEQASAAFDARDKKPGKAAPKEAPKKSKEELFEASKYKVTIDGVERLYIPAAAFKKGMVDAAADSGQSKKDVSKTKARGCFYIRGIHPDHPDKVLIDDAEVDRFDCIGRVGKPPQKTAIPRSRARLRNWSATVLIEYSDRMRAEDIVHLLNLAGDGQGVGDWRPGISTSSGGECGRFEIVGARTMEDGE